MPIDPSQYHESHDKIKSDLNLSNDDEIIPTGYEHLFDPYIREILGHNFTISSQMIRNLPDYFILNHNTGDSYFVERKDENCNSVEAVQLLQNKQHERNGVKIYYSIGSLKINASLIPMDVVNIPLVKRKKFDDNVKCLFDLEGCKLNYMDTNTKGSGDPFIWIDKEDLILLSGEFLNA